MENNFQTMENRKFNEMNGLISMNINEIKAIINEFHNNNKNYFLTTDVIDKYKSNVFNGIWKFSGWSLYAMWNITLMNHQKELGIRHTKVGVPVFDEPGIETSCSEWEIIS